MESSNIIFLVSLCIFGYLFNKYSLFILKKFKVDFLLDNQFNKPQAFHGKPTYRTGGILIYILIFLTFLYLFFYKNILLIEYISFCTLFFLLGFVDDLKINVRPKFRLLMMVVFLFFLTIYNNFYIEKTGLEFLKQYIEIFK